MSRRLRSVASEVGVVYVGMDFDPGADHRMVDVQASLTRLPFPDASVGLMSCFHVLEHIPDDAAAMREITRVLAPGGVAVVQVPRRTGVPTDEEPTAPPEERVRRFGQRDHVRFYGDDFEERLQAAGLRVQAITMKELYRPIECDLLGIDPDEPLWMCTTDASVDVEALAGDCAASARAAVASVLERAVAERDGATARAQRLTERVVKLRKRVKQLRSRVRRADRDRRAAVAQLKHLRGRPDVRVTGAVARRIKRWTRIRPRSEAPTAPKEPTPTAPVDEAALLKASPVFDLGWYEQEAGRTFSGIDEAVAHYRTEGAARQLSPHPLFDPAVVDRPANGITPVGSYLTSRPGEWPVPHPGWDVAAYLRREPGAARHQDGPLGHLAERLTDTTALDVRGLADPTQVPWGEAEAWRDLALTWTAQQRLVLPPYASEPPDDSALNGLPPVEHTPETLVSIVIPTWNRSALLRRALASVRDQTWSHWEAVVVNDGSEDDTRAVVAALAEEDPRIRLVNRPHEGVCAARNAGLAAARGGFIAFLDSDNEWKPDFLKAMVGAMTARGLDAAYGALMLVTNNGPRYRSNHVTAEILQISPHVDLNVLVVRSALMQRIGGFDTALPRAVDYDLVLRLADVADLAYVPVVATLYDSSGADRISARHPFGWTDYVKLRHRMDWDRVAALERDDNLVSVVVPCFARPDVLLEQLRTVREALDGRPWQAVVVDATTGRQAAGLLAAVVTTEPVHYVRLPRPVSFAFAADVGFKEATGSTLVVLGSAEVPEVGALRQLVAYADSQTSPFVAQPVTVDPSGVVVTAGAAVGADQQLPGALLARRRLGDVGSVPLGLSAPDGRTFVIRAADFARLRGLDPLLHNELELADLGLRLRAMDPDAVVDLLPAARVRQVVRTAKSKRSEASRQVFSERHGILPPTPEGTWARLGVRATGWKSTEWPHAVRAVLQGD
jgi:glycosyltransferase involved in cell wall biosynthesis/SAM-dependent methyltransferase